MTEERQVEVIAWSPALAAAAAAGLAGFWIAARASIGVPHAAEFVAGGVAVILAALASATIVRRSVARRAERSMAVLASLSEAARELAATTTVEQAIDGLNTRLAKLGASNAAVWVLRDGELGLERACFTYRSSYESLANEVSRFIESGRLKLNEDGNYFHKLQGPFGPFGVVVYSGALDESATFRVQVETLVSHAATAIQRAMLSELAVVTKVQGEREALQTALLSSLSHDLRTPIATIVASSSFLQRDDINIDLDARNAVARTIQSEAERLNRYVGHLLDMTRLQFGAFEPGREGVDPREMLESVASAVEGRLLGRTLRIQCRRGVHPVSADSVLLERAMINAVENAVDHTPPTTEILLAAVDEGERVVLSVEDDGPGIPADALDRVFEKFYSGASDRGRSVGIGLGLSVSRGLVESMGGAVRAVSPTRNGRGSRFEFSLPKLAEPEQCEWVNR